MAFPPSPLKFNHYSFAVMKKSENHLLLQQKEALNNLYQWFQPGSETQQQIALVSMPTGSGKTGVMACLPYFLGSIGLNEPNDLSSPPSGDQFYPFDKPVLVIAPDKAISKQLEEQLSVSQSGSIGEAFLIKRGIVPEAYKHVLPKAKKIESTAELEDQHPLETNELIIANAQKFLSDKWENELPDDMFRLVIVDEAHHHPARTWQRIVQKFQNHAQVVFFTATPYRGDGKQVLENVNKQMAYHLSLAAAVAAGIIRQTNFSPDQELQEIDPLLNIKVRNPQNSTPDGKCDVGRMVTILRKVKELLLFKNENHQLPGGVPHMAMAIAANTVQADLLLELWKELYPDDAAETYHSNLTPNQMKEIMAKLKNNQLRLVIVVGMLLEGFDHPPISIAAITCKISSPVKFAQFVGRAQRIYRGTKETEKNGEAHIITHIDYNQRQLYDNLIKETLIPDDPSED